MNLNNSISNIKNIGEKRIILFNKLNIFTVQDLLEYYPRHYEDRSNIKKIDELIIGAHNTLIAKIKKQPENLNINNKTMTKLTLYDNSSEIQLVWFNRPYLKKYFQIGNEYIFYGKVVDKFGKIQMDNPDYELLSMKEMLSVGRIVPIYPVTYGLSQKIMRNIIKDTLDNFQGIFVDNMPSYIKDEFNLCDKQFAVFNIHFPKSDADFFSARRRLIFEEFFVLQMSLLKLKSNVKTKLSGIKLHNINANEIINNLAYDLTNAQKKVLDEITDDFNNGFIMNRLIQGDVGSGKTIVALISAYIIIKNGFQAAIMVPTEVLALQHYNYFKSFFDKMGINVVLLTGSLKKKEKDSALAETKSGTANMIVGTHAIIQSGVSFKNLGLVITDEQHRFGVNQRESFLSKGINPHVLVMTATPIPRTLALILYGDLDISIIDELPPGRQKVDTFHVNHSYMDRIYIFVQKEIENGRQCYIVCSMIDESDNKDLKAVVSYTETLKEKLCDIKIELLHGKMKQAEKNLIMDSFSQKEIDIIVSTTVIEVGINVPNATIMIIENAERFGLSQLHQLRGRVGRGTAKSYCIMVSDTKNKHTKKRLKAMTDSNDGFYISELDLSLRGPGDFFGTRQHGLPELKIANLYIDREVLKQVQIAVNNFDYKKLTKQEKENMENYLNTFFNNEKILL